MNKIFLIVLAVLAGLIWLIRIAASAETGTDIDPTFLLYNCLILLLLIYIELRIFISKNKDK